MNFSFLLLEFLKKQGNVSLGNFGAFYLKNTNAILDKAGANILPPGKEIIFNTDSKEKGLDFIKFVSFQNKISEIEAEIEIKKQINFWNSTLEKNQKVTIENVGTLFLDDHKIYFTSSGTANISPDFYGLEEINISEIKKKKFENSYHSGKSVYWIIPLLIGVLTLTYFGITQPEKIFGKKSFGENLKKKPVQKITKDSLKRDSTLLQNINSDFLKKDSVHNANPSKILPANKWNSTK